jgi:RNA polymerase subunit RPABC4/transcription elongation factor Spt4
LGVILGRVFELFHLSLLRKPEELFDIDVPTREAWLREALAKKLEFVHRTKSFYWVPYTSAAGDIVGTVVRETEHLHHKSPDEGATEVVGSEWQGAVVIIDPEDHNTGQRIAFEKDNKVGRGGPILDSLIEHINERADAKYTIRSKPIFDTSTFWTFAEKHSQVVRKIAFDFVTPNMWGARSNLEQELRATREDTGAQKAKVELSSVDGVKTNNDRIKEGVDYAGDGGGSVSAVALNGESFRSGTKKSTTSVDDSELVGDDKMGIIKSLATKILRRS